MTYGQPFHTGNVTAIRHLDQHQNGEFLEFLVAGKSQGKLRMPADLPRDAVGCIGACNGQGGGISAIAPASFQVGQHGPGVSLHNGRGGGSNSTAVWSAGLGSCNQIAFLTPDTRQVGTVQFTVSLGTGVGSFIDIGWCSPSLDPTGKTYKPGPKKPPSEYDCIYSLTVPTYYCTVVQGLSERTRAPSIRAFVQIARFSVGHDLHRTHTRGRKPNFTI